MLYVKEIYLPIRGRECHLTRRCDSLWARLSVKSIRMMSLMRPEYSVSKTSLTTTASSRQCPDYVLAGCDSVRPRIGDWSNGSNGAHSLVNHNLDLSDIRAKKLTNLCWLRFWSSSGTSLMYSLG